MWLQGSPRWRTWFHEDKECELFAGFRILRPHVPWGQRWVTQVDVPQLSNTSPWNLFFTMCSEQACLAWPEGRRYRWWTGQSLSFALEMSPISASQGFSLSLSKHRWADSEGQMSSVLPLLAVKERMTNTQGELSPKKCSFSGCFYLCNHFKGRLLFLLAWIFPCSRYSIYFKTIFVLFSIRELFLT